ncbi:MAG: alpha/beta hydrolase [Synergistaceae bacterium]|nr:alpha/beta hydrolase [Synergistaceae bacterium]
MKIFCALILILFMLPSVSSAKDFTAWNLNDMIHPQLKEGLMKVPYFELTPETLGTLRKVLAGNPELLPKDDSVDVRNEIIGSNLRVRIYTPKTGAEKYPVLLWLHEGGFISGVPEMDERLILKIVKAVRCIVVSPDYRLAPENPCRAAFDDCYETLLWATENLPIRKDRLAVGGCSAGATLAASMALMARDRKGPQICFQFLLYPHVDFVNDTPSMRQINDTRVWCRELELTSRKFYPENADGKLPDFMSPALADDLSGLPPAYILTGTLDVFRDEIVNYAQRLMQSGVPVELHVIPGIVHACEFLFPNAPVCVKFVNEYINALSEALK